MVREDEYTRAIVSTLRGMSDFGPEDFLELVAHRLSKSGKTIDEFELVRVLTGDDVNSREHTDFRIALARWDAESEPEWSGDTPPRTRERRSKVLDLLGFSEDAAEQINGVHPAYFETDVVIADPDWSPWYTPERQRAHRFYWNAYSGVLGDKLDASSLASVDSVTTDIVSRLADPAAKEPYQSKGLVVGHVQSGKTANFTGVIAKAIDAGYRLVIVLTGTVELLRAQTQRRLDMELIGKENILGGRDENDPTAVSDIDYVSDGDSDWLLGRFVDHGVDFGIEPDVPAIRRLTGKAYDYKRLAAGLDALDFRSGNELRNPRLPVWDAENLYSTDVRIAVVKKNKSVLTKLVQDLKNVRARLDEIPVLIVDDEADQASVNTINPARQKSPDETERTAINALLAELLGELKRSQYVGYTATPFANVFVSPDDSEDIFPKDFIISLNPPPAYMGGTSFHDLEPVDEEYRGDPGFSNEAAFVRNLEAESEDDSPEELRSALDAFVLSGAIKLWRAGNGHRVKVDHHTMLVHETVKQADHKILATAIRREWASAGYSSPSGLARLRSLYETDFQPVSASRDWEAPMPTAFEDLRPHIGAALDKIMMLKDPVVVVNGDKDNEYEQIDFDKADIWRILVGGTKLSRGFTVEGLTITYYRRRAQAADSLMQMGRWFGYRPGYRDLVRLYVARRAIGPRGKALDLYEAFQAIIEDEEEFRAQLRTFSEVTEEGEPVLRPIDVPPMVFQQLPWLTPTSRNKMYNAEIGFMGEGGKLKDFPRQPLRGKGENNRRHFTAVRGWLDRLSSPTKFGYYDSVTDKPGEFDARTAIVSADEMLKALSDFEWVEGFDFSPTIAMLQQAMGEGGLEDWAVMVPYLGKHPVLREVDGVDIPLLKRTRRGGTRGGFSGSSFRQRDAVERIAGNMTRIHAGAEAEALYAPTRGSMLLTFAADPVATQEDRDPRNMPDEVKPEDVATLFSLVIPESVAPRGRIGFRVRDEGRRKSAIVPRKDI
ncbi:hypothetical protein K8P10_001379 [Leucobacter sp. Psy1]|uniref:Z1 domain-containing protein n=1 Tax=Leucobacter sp. Psy1 TaxID=2875729 RepID=UPI001CD209E4|nr:Z1 domain-containing protein [Leucobacter sp. Psy1]UBH05868.1 hypothetical protein K8P10_001379 [Leucobacter sp. Psy1]